MTSGEEKARKGRTKLPRHSKHRDGSVLVSHAPQYSRVHRVRGHRYLRERVRDQKQFRGGKK